MPFSTTLLWSLSINSTEIVSHWRHLFLYYVYVAFDVQFCSWNVDSWSREIDISAMFWCLLWRHIEDAWGLPANHMLRCMTTPQSVGSKWFISLFGNGSDATFRWSISSSQPSFLLKAFVKSLLTHWGRVTHICVSQLITIVSDNGWPAPSHYLKQWWNIVIWTREKKFQWKILIEIYTFSFTKMHLKMSSGKWRPSSICLNMLTLVTQAPGFNTQIAYPSVTMAFYIETPQWSFARITHLSQYGIPCGDVARCPCNAVKFLQNPYNRHPISSPLTQAM